MKILKSIIEIFEKNDNNWLDCNEIYAKLNPNLFGPNIHGDEGKKGIVSNNFSTHRDIFDVDKNSKPYKYRLSTQCGSINTQFINTQVKYSYGNSRIIHNGNEYKIWEFSSEEEFEKEVLKNYKMIFGDNSIYFDIKKKLGDRICDGFVFDKNLNRLIIVENELCRHGLWEHIIPQIIGFFNAFNAIEKDGKEGIKNKLKHSIEWGMDDSKKLKLIESIDKSEFDIVVVIDNMTPEILNQQRSINKLISEFAKNKSMKVYFKELKVFINNSGEKIYQIS